MRISPAEARHVMTEGASWAVKRGFGSESDLEYIEENGRFSGADPEFVSVKAYQRGKSQLGTLGSGNHYLGMGRELMLRWPEVIERLDAESGRLRDQSMQRWFLPQRNDYSAGWEQDARRQSSIGEGFHLPPENLCRAARIGRRQ